MKIYLVGGAVRDKLLGLKPKDLDYVVVLDNINLSVEEGFKVMENYLVQNFYGIFLSTPEMFTIRAKFPTGHKNQGMDADFVLARKEVGYVEGTRRPILELGTLFDDLQRRDFTINAMAEDEEGVIIDPFNGRLDLENKILKTPVDPNITLLDDPLRVLRAMRFSVTKGMRIDNYLREAIQNKDVWIKMFDVVSEDRMREEFLKMFSFDTEKALKMLYKYGMVYSTPIFNICFSGDMWLKPTTEKRKVK